MALPDHLSFLRRGSGGQCLEVYLDPLCNPSGRAFASITSNVLPLIEKGGMYEGKLSIVVRIYPNPSHYLAAFHSEALLLFGKIYGTEHFWAYFSKIFETQSQYGAVNGMDLSGNQVRDQLTALAMEVLQNQGLKSDDGHAKDFRGKMVNQPPANGRGPAENDASKDLKYLARQGRQNGVVVTLTGVFNGVRDDSISSSWGKEEWEKFLASKFQ